MSDCRFDVPPVNNSDSGLILILILADLSAVLYIGNNRD